MSLLSTILKRRKRKFDGITIIYTYIQTTVHNTTMSIFTVMSILDPIHHMVNNLCSNAA